MLRALLTYWRTGKVYRPCSICGKGRLELPKGSTPFTHCRVYHMKCCLKQMGR